MHGGITITIVCELVSITCFRYGSSGSKISSNSFGSGFEVNK